LCKTKSRYTLWKNYLIYLFQILFMTFPVLSLNMYFSPFSFSNANSLQSDPFSFPSAWIITPVCAFLVLRRLWSGRTLSALQSIAVMSCFVASVLSSWILLYQFTFTADMISWSTRKRHVVYARLQWCFSIFRYLNETFIPCVQVKVEWDDNSEEREFPKIRRLSDLYRGPSGVNDFQMIKDHGPHSFFMIKLSSNYF
jgi:hypothetical protein